MAASANKRGRADGVEATPDAGVTRSELEELLGEMREELVTNSKDEVATAVQAAVTAYATSSSTSFLSSQTKMLEKYDAKHSQKIAQVNARVDRVETRVEAVAAQAAAATEEIKALREQLVLANKNDVSTQEVNAEEFDRPPRLSVLRVGCASRIPKTAVEEALTPWLARMGEINSSPDACTLAGPAIGNSWELRFKGSPLVAARICKKTNELLKDDAAPNGWKEIHATNPTDKASLKLFINPDESPEARTIRTMRKRFLAVAKEVPALAASFAKRSEPDTISVKIDGKITAYARLAAKSEAPEDQDILWDYEVVEKLEIDKARLVDEFKQSGHSSADLVEWRK